MSKSLARVDSIPELLTLAHKVTEANRTSSTRRAYAADWRTFEAWCASHGVRALPALPEVVVAYLTHLGASGAKVSTIERALVALRHAHREANVDWPEHRGIRETMKGLRRTLGTAQKKAAPIQDTDLPALLAGESSRDRALVLVGWSAALRRSELVALDVSDIEFSPQGVKITVRRSKTDQEGAGMVRAIPMGRALCPVKALWVYLQESGISEGRVFPLSDRTVVNVLRRIASKAGLDPARVSGHSLRAGFMSTAAVRGKSLAAIMRQSGHKSERVALGYIRAATVWQDNAADGLL